MMMHLREIRLKPGEVYMPAPMPYWMRLTNYGIGMHVGNIPQPGEPASHGCIRMPEEFVPTLFNKVEVGTPVNNYLLIGKLAARRSNHGLRRDAAATAWFRVSLGRRRMART